MTEREWITTGEAARALNITGLGERNLRKAAAAGRLKPAHTTPGGHYLWDLEDLKRQLDEAAQRPRKNLDDS